MTAGVRARVRELGLTTGEVRFDPGQVVPAVAADSSASRQTVLFAAAVPAGGTTTAGIVEEAARGVGDFASSPGSTTAFPLLGTGAGGLSPEVALTAIVAGFRTSAHADAIARVYVLDQKLYDELRPEASGETNDPFVREDDESSTVKRARSKLAPRGAVLASSLVEEILTHHSEYAGRTGGSVQFAPEHGAIRKEVPEWLADVRGLFDPALGPILHGRLVIIGLSLLDPLLRRALDSGGFRDRLIGELHEPLTKIMTQRGAELYAGSTIRDENVPTHTDNPAIVDELGRKGFARVLARRIRDARKEEAGNAARAPDPRARRGGAFLVHLHAPWEAGKTSLLNFLATELRAEDQDLARRSVVVNFNAWRHQRIAPPWWWLMTTMYSEAVHGGINASPHRGGG
jgi:hypothetical protein